jgi:short-subunit dehydrogenase
MTTNIHNYILHRQLNWFSQKMMVHPRQVAKMTMDKALKGQEIIIPGRLNRVLHRVSSAIPSGISKMLIMKSMKQLEKKEQAAPA